MRERSEDLFVAVGKVELTTLDVLLGAAVLICWSLAVAAHSASLRAAALVCASAATIVAARRWPPLRRRTPLKPGQPDAVDDGDSRQPDEEQR